MFFAAILLALRATPSPAADTALAPAAKAELDSALAVVRHNALWRDTVSWSVVEPEVRAASLGYVAVPGYSGGAPDAIRAYAARMHQVLAASLPRARCGWVVDLRGNGGGNMYPMLAGLRPFLGDGTVAIAFRGRPRTRSFGAPTRGLSTANTMIPLPDGARLVLTVAVDADRTGRRYGGVVEPDERVGPAQGGEAGEGDEALARAEAWLAGASGCRAPGAPGAR